MRSGSNSLVHAVLETLVSRACGIVLFHIEESSCWCSFISLVLFLMNDTSAAASARIDEKKDADAFWLFGQQTRKGILEITVREAKGLKNPNRFGGKADPYW